MAIGGCDFYIRLFEKEQKKDHNEASEAKLKLKLAKNSKIEPSFCIYLLKICTFFKTGRNFNNKKMSKYVNT